MYLQNNEELVLREKENTTKFMEESGVKAETVYQLRLSDDILSNSVYKIIQLIHTDNFKLDEFSPQLNDLKGWMEIVDGLVGES